MLLDLHRHLLSWNAITDIFPWAELFLQTVNGQTVMFTVLFTFLDCVNYVLPVSFLLSLFFFTGSLWCKYFLIYEVKASSLFINRLGEFFMKAGRKKKLVY